MEEKIINVGLYGGKSIFGGKETPQEASVIYCDKHQECSYFKNNQCLNVRAPSSNRCKYGRVNNIKGYTSRAAKYYNFNKTWKGHENYGKLSYPPSKLGLIDGEVVLPYAYIRVKETEPGKFDIDVPYFSSNISFIAYEKFTPELINRICDFKPQAMMGGEISGYRKEVIPLFLAHLKEVLPEKYKELSKNHNELTNEISYVGRKALLKTINPSEVCYKSRQYPQFNEVWHWDGEVLAYVNGYVHGFSIIKDYEVVEIKIKPSDKSIITISNNEQVTKETIFTD